MKQSKKTKSVRKKKACQPPSGVRVLFDTVRIENVRLLDSRFFWRGKPDDPLYLELGWKPEGKRSAESDVLRIHVSFSLRGRTSEDEREEPSLLVEATFEAVYKVPPDVKVLQKDIEFFAQANGAFNLWPYWREYVQSVSTRMGLPSFTVPSYREEVFTKLAHAHRRGDARSHKSSKRRTQHHLATGKHEV